MILTDDIEKVIAGAIPIYTRKRPNPKSGKEDCPITVSEKEQFRSIMKKKLLAAKDEEKPGIIDHYKELFN